MNNFFSKRILTLLAVSSILFGFSGCVGTGSGGSDLNSRMARVEDRVNTISTQIDGTQSADVWNKMQHMESQLTVIQNQMNDLDNRMSGPKGNQVMSANERLDRMENALRQIASQLGIKIEALDEPYTPPEQPAQSQETSAYGGSAYNAPQGQPQDAYENANMQQPATNPDGTVTVLINGVPRQVPVAGSPGAATSNPAPQSDNTGNAPYTSGPTSGASHAPGTDVAQNLYDNGLDFFNKRQYQEALKCFQDFTANYPDHKLTGNAWFWQGECDYQLSDYSAAVIAYQKVITNYSNNDKYVSSLLKQGMALSESGSKDAAKVRWREIVNKYPKSPEAVRAKKLLGGGK